MRKNTGGPFAPPPPAGRGIKRQDNKRIQRCLTGDLWNFRFPVDLAVATTPSSGDLWNFLFAIESIIIVGLLPSADSLAA